MHKASSKVLPHALQTLTAAFFLIFGALALAQTSVSKTNAATVAVETPASPPVLAELSLKLSGLPELTATPSTQAANPTPDKANRPVLSDASPPVSPPVQAEILSNLWDRMRKGFSMPTLDTQLATDKTNWYAKQPDYMARMSQRGSQYLFYIVEELEKRGMPTELALLPFVESAFNPQAVSSAKAAGMWQFMPATGKHFNLKQNVWQDDRRGVVESTRAALDYLQKLHAMFGDWHLALAAYNWGEGSVQRAMNKNRAKGLPTEYTALKMPLETQQYVPKFQAVKNIIQSPESYGISLAPLANAPFFASVVKDRDIDVDLAAKFAGLSLPEFKSLNPGFKTPVILGESKSEILLPASKVVDFNKAMMNHTGALSSWTTAHINATEKPAALAHRFGMSEAELREVNNIPPRMLIRSGSILVVPKTAAASRNPEASNISMSLADHAQLNLTPEAPRRMHTVRKGETVNSLAKRFGISPADIRSWNSNLSAEVFTGQKITLYVALKTTKARAKTTKRVVKKRNKKV